MKFQPSLFIRKNNIGWFEGNAIKYICRYHLKGGKEDLDKAIHYLELIKEELEEDEQLPSDQVLPFKHVDR